MKKHHSIIAAGVCAGTFCVLSAHAQSSGSKVTTTTTVTTVTTEKKEALPPSTYDHSPASRVYVGVDVGGALTADPKVKEFLGPVSTGSKVSLDPGIRVGFIGGYKLTDWLSVEGETGVIANNVKSITDASLTGNATLANIPFLINARLELPHGKCPITPYIGGGAGGSATLLGFEHHIDINGNRIEGNDSDVVFAYQAFGGLRYAINDHMGVDLAYHYFATTGASWEASGVGSPNKIAFSGVQSHAITASFDYRF